MRIKLAQIAIIIFSLCSTIAFSESLYSEDLIQSLKDSDQDGVINARDVCKNTVKGANVDHNGCQLEELEYFNFTFDVQFDAGQYELRPEFYSKLEDLASYLKSAPDTILLIEGHTDDIGSDSDNLELSKKRSESIANILISVFSITPDRIKTFGFGEQRPLKPNDTEAGQKVNRRVTGEIVKPLEPLEEGTYESKDRPYISHNKIIIPFGSNQYNPAKYNRSILQSLGEFLQKEPDTFIIIEGYTDSSGNEAKNIDLSIERAQSIANTLNTQHDISHKRLRVLGYGSDFPIVSNETLEGRKQNRRVNIEIVTKFKLHKSVAIQKWTIWNVSE